MKKRAIFILSLLATALFSLIRVSAADFFGADIRGGAEFLIEIIQDMGEPIISALFGSSDLMFEKFLFLGLLLVVIGAIFKRVPFFRNNKAARIISTIAVSLLATRFLTEIEWAQAVLIPYHVLGVALLSFLPFLIFFWFIEKEVESPIVRKIAWCLYAIVFIGLWWSKYSVIGTASWIYFATAVLAIIVMLADRLIQGFFVRSAIMQGLDLGRTREMVSLKKRIDEDYELLEHATGEQRRKILRSIADNENTLKALSRRPYR